jgi:spermidine synthase
VLALFFFSGASALVYEVVWTRELTYVFGGSAFAIATVLAAFMAGLALGSKVLGGLIDRRGHPLVVYALLEVGIAVFAVVLPVIFGLLPRVYAPFYGSGGMEAVRFGLSFLVLLLPTTLMGGTLPVLGKLLLRNWDGLGLRAGLLYGVNTFGAVVGVAAGGFVLMPALGLQGATLVAVGVNLIIAAGALVLARRVPLEAVTDELSEAPAVVGAPAPSLRRAVLIVYAASGFAALSYEVAWTKTLSMILGTTTYAFTSMLATFLLGLALGSALFARLSDRYGRPAVLLALVQTGIPLLVLATVPVMGYLPQLFVDGFTDLRGSWFQLELYRIALAASIMFAPAVLMGGTFPLVSRVYLGGANTGSRLGSLYAANTVGAILGSFATGFLLLPWFGRQNSILIASVVNILAVLLLLAVIRWRHVPSRARWSVATAAIALVPALWLGLQPWNTRVMASGAYIYAEKYAQSPSIRDALDGNHLLFYEEGPEGTVSVWQWDYQTILRTNGKVDASSHLDMITQKFLAHLPALYHRGEMRDGLVIGLGSGVSTGSLLSYPIERVDTVELMPGMVEAAGYFDDANGNCMADPRHRVVWGDGRNHLRLADQRYDVIVSEPSNPWIAGIGALFTKEFFEIAGERLRNGGVLSQWVQIYDFSEADLKTIFATIMDAFPHVHVWRGSPADLILVASHEPLRLDIEAVWRALGETPGQDLAATELGSLAQLLAYFVTDRDGMKKWVGKWEQRVTDDNLYLEYAVPRHMFTEGRKIRFGTFDDVWTSPTGILENIGDLATLAEEIEKYQLARYVAYRAHHENALPDGMTSEEQVLGAALRMAPDEVLSRELWAKRLLQLGVDDMNAGRVVAARAAFQDASRIGLRGQKARAFLYLGSIAQHAGFPDSAATLWARSRDLEPRYPDPYFYLGRLAGMRGDLAAAQDLLAQATALAPQSATAWLHLAEVHVAREEWQDAMECVSAARDADPTSPEVQMVEEVVLRRTGKPARVQGQVGVQ